MTVVIKAEYHMPNHRPMIIENFLIECIYPDV